MLNIISIFKAMVGGREATRLVVGEGATVRQVTCQLKEMGGIGGSLALIEFSDTGQRAALVTLSFFLIPRFDAVAVFDPPTASYIVATACGGRHAAGDSIPASQVAVLGSTDITMA